MSPHGRRIGPASISPRTVLNLYALKAMEGEPESNPTRTAVPKYRSVGRAMVAYGIKLSVDAGFNGDVTLDAKTPELARHYERDFGAFRVPGRERNAAPRYLICDEAAQVIFTDYLEEG